MYHSEETATSGVQGGVGKISEVCQSMAQKAPPDEGSNTEYDPVLER